jgi:hypothetical protein
MTKLVIRLGPQGQHYTDPQPGTQVLGTVQEGQAIGALVRLADGSYAQVNGDFVRPLSTSRVDYIIAPKLRKQRGAPPPPEVYEPPPPRDPNSPPVVVVVKKRRVVVPPGAA